ncbi:MAG: hypothetical protein M1813_003177 [Trichoglossum hirsutum]|nr:MAG: hypothetical protein M1813_003177 [Trichoglossum hirsutum]
MPFTAVHHLWYLLIEEYTLRSLTRPNDKFPAISGLAGIFQNFFGTRSKYIAGIWSGDMLNGLSWRPSRPGLEGMGKVRTLALGPQSTYHRPPSFSWASVNGPVYFYAERRGRLVGEDNYSAQVLNIDSSPIGFNSLGEVSEGLLELRARVIPFHRILEESGGDRGRSLFDRDDPSLDPPDKRILCIIIRNISFGYLGEDPSIVRQCLLLLPTGSGEGIHRRVGCYDQHLPEPPRPLVMAGVNCTGMFKDLEPPKSKPPYEGWEEMDVKIIRWNKLALGVNLLS